MVNDDGSPLFSIIMTVSNFVPNLLKVALKSLAAQTLSDFELVLETRNESILEFARGICNDLEILLVAGVDTTLHTRSARFKAAVDNARGGWCAILDADDVLHPNALFRVAECLERYPHHDFFRTSHAAFIDKPWESVTNLAMPLAQTAASLEYTFIQRHFWGFRNERNRWPKLMLASPYDVEDYWVFCELAKNARPVLHIPDVLYGWRRWQGQWTEVFRKDAKEMCEDIRLKMRMFNKKQGPGFFMADNLMAVRLMKCYAEMERDTTPTL